MSAPELLVTPLERAVIRVEATGASRVWLDEVDGIDRVNATYGTTAQARAAVLAFGVPTLDVVFPVRVFVDRHTTVVIHDRPRGAHRAAAPTVTRHYPNGAPR